MIVLLRDCILGFRLSLEVVLSAFLLVSHTMYMLICVIDCT